jgi:hypothetical protein
MKNFEKKTVFLNFSKMKKICKNFKKMCFFLEIFKNPDADVEKKNLVLAMQ